MSRALHAVIFIMAIQLGSRGLDYLLGNPATVISAFPVNGNGSVKIWGACCLTISLVVLVGIMARAPHLVRSGAVFAMALYLAFAVLAFDDVFLTGVVDDWRFFTLYLSTAALWAVIAWSLTIHLAVIRGREADGTGNDSRNIC
ncbi:hypothetical protein CPHO_07005 [Corynebacterium phocae]|uniref:Uncharacterized protein n=1 Tax=Corynebacterium phocae TaxID=161895 RepID=A0A1L7D3N3_9CORY|nr:hypothetical protein CPHO_07005 [Corynebacterium phocae]